jgi:serine phosphatase RsbU (regulator of sigma subunit)/pSer/pThr/pTyr-binding forkhead associated (FHA) protein
MPAPQLKVKDSQGRRVVQIAKPAFSIGRRSSADLQVVSTDVSREHAEIMLNGDQYVLHDRGSRYGTFVNGEPVTERTLVNGDRIRLGRTDAVELVFALDLMDSSGLGDSATEITDLGQMAAILNGLRAIGSGRVLDEVLTLVIDSALDVTKAERGFVMLSSAEGELEFKVARAAGRMSLPGSSFTTSAKIPREVHQTGRSRIVADLMDGSLSDSHEGTIAIGIRHVMCVPLLVAAPGADGAASSQTRVIGVLYLDGRERASMTSDATRGSLEAFATQAAIAIESARLYAESAEKARTDRDLRVAADIQKALLPEAQYESATGELAASSIPCRTVGGDFFDYVDIDEGALGFSLGDVAGKGPPAALLAAMVQSNFVALAPLSADPAEALARINKALLRRAIEARFATMFYGVAYPDGRFRYCNAGQEPALVVRAEGEEWLDVGGPVLGLLSVATYESAEIQLKPGDLVIIYSDGVTEARAVDNSEFERDGLLQVARACRGQKPDTVLEALLGAIRTFSHGAAQADDITALVYRYRGR